MIKHRDAAKKNKQHSVKGSENYAISFSTQRRIKNGPDTLTHTHTYKVNILTYTV